MKGEENQSGWDNGNKRKIENNSEKRNITDFGIVSYECWSAENLIDGGDGVTIPPVVARIFSGDRSSPLTRWARTWCGARVGVTIPQSCDR